MKLLKADGSIDVKLVGQTISNHRNAINGLYASLRAAGASPMLLEHLDDAAKSLELANDETSQLYD